MLCSNKNQTWRRKKIPRLVITIGLSTLLTTQRSEMQKCTRSPMNTMNTIMKIIKRISPPYYYVDQSFWLESPSPFSEWKAASEHPCYAAVASLWRSSTFSLPRTWDCFDLLALQAEEAAGDERNLQSSVLLLVRRLFSWVWRWLELERKMVAGEPLSNYTVFLACPFRYQSEPWVSTANEEAAVCLIEVWTSHMPCHSRHCLRAQRWICSLGRRGVPHLDYLLKGTRAFGRELEAAISYHCKRRRRLWAAIRCRYS
jgi:hypothetical protein